MLPSRCLSKRALRTRAFNPNSRHHSPHVHFSTKNYDSTISNLKIGAHTRVIFQGFTGKLATANAKESIEWGTNVVGGVKPGGSGEHLGLPVLPSVRAAMEQLKPDATGIYVAAHQATAAIEEAIEAEVPLIVAVAEHIPLHDIMRIHSMLRTQSKSRLVGANAPGIISAIGKCRIGFQPLPTFSPGHIGIVAKSGTLSYETVGSLTRAGLGQSLCIAVGGDVIAGTNFVDALKVFESDDDTEAIIIVGELGGTTEEEVAEWIVDYRKRVTNPKPIAAVIGGFQAAPGKVMGHAGAWTGLGEGSAESKYRALQNAGVTMVDHPAKFGNVMKAILAKSGRSVRKIERSAAQQRRSYHISHRPRLPENNFSIPPRKRSLHLSADQSAAVLKSYSIDISPELESSESSHFLGIDVARSARSPCIIAAPTTNSHQLPHRVRRYPFDYREGPNQTTITKAIQYLQLDSQPPAIQAQVGEILEKLWRLYKEKEAISTTLHLSISSSSSLTLSSPTLLFDDAAFKSCSRQSEIHALRDKTSLTDNDLAAEKAGIVYIPLPTPAHLLRPDRSEPTNLIATLVNGAGLAMNTNDVLSLRLSHPTSALAPTTSANFLDTGGKATASTISTSFKLILSDPRVSCVFVNIFGGLTLCDMIAEGIIMAFREVGVEKPVVVRLRGTREEEGRKVLRESGLSVFAFDGFEEAVECLGRVANGLRPGEVSRGFLDASEEVDEVLV